MDTATILANLQALANLPKPNAQASASNPAQGSSANNVSYPPSTMAQSAPPVNTGYTMSAAAPAVNAHAPVNGGAMYGFQSLFPNGLPSQAPAQPPMMPQNNQPASGGDGGLQQQLQILSALKSQGIPEAQWPALLAVLMQSNSGGNASAALANMSQQPPPMTQNHGGYGGGRDGSSRDRNGYDQYIRSPPGGRYRDRSRSRSPRRGDRYRNDSPPRRGSPVYGDYGGRDGANRRSDRNRGGERQRSPNRDRRSPSPRKEDIGHYERFLEFDPSLGDGMIKGKSTALTPAPHHDTSVRLVRSDR